MGMLSGKPGSLFELFILNYLADNNIGGERSPERDDRLIADLGMDGIDFYELILAIDAKFGFEHHDPAFEDQEPVTVDDVVSYCIANYRYNHKKVA